MLSLIDKKTFSRLGDDQPITTKAQIYIALGKPQPFKVTTANQNRLDETRTELLANGLLRPTYQHDCHACTYLGRYCLADDLVFADLYHCVQAGVHTDIPTVIARFSDEGSDYQSGMHMKGMPYLVEAQRRAYLAGLLINHKRHE